MAGGFQEILEEHKQELIEVVLQRLKSSTAPHYKQLEPGQLKERIEQLVAPFIRSCQGDPSPFVQYIEQLTEERISEGYFLSEIQLTLSLLEEQAWKIAVERSNLHELLPRLGRITSVTGGAKDRLAQIYLSHKQRADSAVAILERRLEALFKGTEGSELPANGVDDE